MPTQDISPVAAGFLEDVTASDFWTRTANAIASWVDPTAVCQIMIGRKGGEPDQHVISGNRPGHLLREYTERYLSEDRRVPAVLGNPGVFLRGTDGFDDPALDRTALVNDFLDRPEVDARWCMGRADVLDERSMVLLAVMRPRSSGDFAPQEAARTDTLTPHLLQALRVRAKLDAAQLATSRLSSVMNALAEPLIVVDRLLHISFVNAAAAQALEGHALLASCRGRLVARRTADHRALEVAVNQSCLIREGLPAVAAAPLMLRNAAAARDLVALSFTPLPRTDEFGPRAEVMISMSPRVVPDRMIRAVLRAHGCSPTEEETALAVSNGLDLADIARERSVSVETARSQLKAAMRKVDCAGQKDLVRFLAGFR